MVLSPRFSEAFVFAANLHRNQVRKGPKRTPYIGHLLAVASIVIDSGGTEDEAIAALLHDAVEDQGGLATREAIRRLFGENVANIVDGCTDATEHPKPAWRPRKERYIEHLREAPPSVVLVSAADKLANARSILDDLRDTGHEVWTRFNCTREENLWYYRTVLDALRGCAPRPLVEELQRVLDEIGRLCEEETCLRA